MDERNDDEKTEKTARTPIEGVRIIGAEEAQAAIEAGQVAPRRPEDAPRFGDVPEQPAGPRPPLRFPLGGDADPAGMTLPPMTPAPGAARDATGTDLPHWTEPPTGENPRIRAEGDAGSPGDDAAEWAPPAQGPRWRDQASDWDDVDYEDPTVWAGDEETKMGALDPDRPGPSDLFSFDEPMFDEEPEPEPRFVRTRPAPAPGGRTRSEAVAPTVPGLRSGAGRNVGTAVATGLAVAAVVLGSLEFFHNVGGLIVATIVLVLAAVELFGALHERGFRPATLLGLAGTASLAIASYVKGEQAIPLIAGLFVLFTLIWYLWGVETRQPTMNAGASLLGFAYVGVLGSFAALLLAWPSGVKAHGMGLFLGAVIGTVAYDVGGFGIGSWLGRTPLAPNVSPNKTWEGLIGGCGAAFFASVLITTHVHPWSLNRAFALGVVIALAAPLGDLSESMIKRDLGIKDMGTLLPGHGGVLDRIDAMLFVVPATYYLAKFLKIA